MDVLNQQEAHKEEISFQELVGILLRRKWLIVCFVALAALGAVLAAWLSPKKYQSVMVLSPATSNSGGGQLGGIGSLASQFGGLASLAGISVAGDSKKAESLAVLQSDALTTKYIEQNNLLPILFADKWDAQNKRWNITDPSKTPTLWQANEYFKRKVRTVSIDKQSQLVTLTITWKDPHVAAKWGNDLVRMCNDYLRAKAITESERNISYLNSQAATTDVVGVRQAIFSILQSEISRAMLARGSDEYAFKVLDPAVPPERPSSPRPLLWTAAAIFGSLFISVLSAFARLAWSRGA